VPQQPIMLKVLLGQRHWQNYATFCAEYDKAARRIDSDLGQTFPSRAQLHRWLNGSLRSPALRRALPGSGGNVPRLDGRAALPAIHP
jgi:hypothetical protein